MQQTGLTIGGNIGVSTAQSVPETATLSNVRALGVGGVGRRQGVAVDVLLNVGLLV